MRRILPTAVLAATLPGLAAAQDRPTLLDFISVDIIAQRILQSGIMALRTQMDMQYSDMSVDVLTGKITISDVVAWPLPDWDEDGDCKVAVDRFTLRTVALDQPDRLGFSVQLAGASAPAACFPEEAREGFAMAGLDALEIPRATIDIDYGLPSSDAQIHVYADIADVAAIDVNADFSYFWLDGRDDMDDPLPVAFLDHASVAIENRGIWEALKPMVPPPFTAEGSGLMLEGMLGEEMLRENFEPADGGPKVLSETQTAFLKSLSTAWPAFLQNPDTLVLETDIEGDTFLDLLEMDGNLILVFNTLRPVVRLAPSVRQDMLPTSLLIAARDTPDSLTGEEMKRVGIAVMTGVGAPQHRGAGFDILNGFARNGDGEAAMVLAEQIVDVEPEDAYGWALIAGAKGELGATALLDRIEKKLPFGTVLKVQGEVSGNDTHSSDALSNVGLIREQAAMRLSGRGMARSYEYAAMWAMIGAAAGDAESRDILDDVLERVRLSGADAQNAWREVETRASSTAMDAWISQDLPGRLGGN